jgi:hypothetical protein
MLGARISSRAFCGRASRRLWAVVCLSASMLLTSFGTAGANTVIGYVAEKHGTWKLYPHGADSNEEVRDLTNGQEVPAGAAIRIKTPSSSDYIVVMDLHFKPLEQRSCQEPKSCGLPILLPEKAESAAVSDLFAQLSGDVWARLWKEYQPSLHRVRGGAPIMTDGVVVLKNHSIDLGDIMRYARAGRYVLTPVKSTGGEEAGTRRTVFTWDPQTTTTIPVGDLTPGLFDINEESAVAKRPSAKDPPARILVCDPSTYSQVASSFRKIRDVTDGWADLVDPDTTHAFLRSLLASLEKTRSGSFRESH